MMYNFIYRFVTPIEKYGGYFFKRDDLFKPFANFTITGGKLRQCLRLVENNLECIRDEYDNTISTVASVRSPQTVIVARAAKEFGLKCLIGVGTKDHEKHKALRMCSDLGAELVTLSTTWTYDGYLQAKMNKLADERKMFQIKFGYKAETDPEAIIEMNALQASVLTHYRDINKIVIPVGSGVSSVGIIRGIERYRPDLISSNAVLLVQPFGNDRTRTIDTLLANPLANIQNNHGYRYFTGEYDYASPLDIQISDDFKLDQCYEAKSFDYMMKNKELMGIKPTDGVLFWVIGQANVLREP